MTQLNKKLFELIRDHKVLTAILFIGFLLRIAGILWGIPFPDPIEGIYHPDEPKIIWGAVAFPAHIYTNQHLYYPTFFPYSLAIITLPLRFIFNMLGLSKMEFYYTVNVIGRLFSVFAGIGAIILTYFLAREIYDKTRALLASIFLTFSLYHVQNSSFATTDVMSSFFLVLFLYILRRAFLYPEQTSLYLLAGFVLGLLMGTKYTGAIAILALFVVYVYTSFIQPKKKKIPGPINLRKLHLNLLLLFFLAILTLIITTPGIFLHFNKIIDALEFVKYDIGRFYNPRTDPETWLTVFETISIAIGFPLAFLFIFGTIFPIKKNIYETSYIVLLIAFFIFFGAILLPRYIILIAPLIAIIASNGVLWLYRLPGTVFKFLGMLVISLVIAYSLGYCLTGTYLRYNDTRTQAGKFILKNIQPGETIGIGYVSKKYDWKEHPWRYPKIDFNRIKYQDFLTYPKILVLSSFDFYQIERALKSDKLSKNYIWDDSFNNWWYLYTPPSPSIFQFYDDLFNPDKSKYDLLKSFKKKRQFPNIGSYSAEFASPEIRIYIRKN